MTDSQFEQVKEMLGGLGNELVLLTAENAQYVFYSSIIYMCFYVVIPFLIGGLVYTSWKICKKYIKDSDAPDVLLVIGILITLLTVSLCIMGFGFSIQNMVKSCLSPKILMMDKILDATKN